mgnify:CR=1 FL=1
MSSQTLTDEQRQKAEEKAQKKAFKKQQKQAEKAAESDAQSSAGGLASEKKRNAEAAGLTSVPETTSAEDASIDEKAAKKAAKKAAVVDTPIKHVKPKAKKKKLEPMKAGEKTEMRKVSVGNIRSGRRARKLSKKAKENLEQELRDLGASDVQLKKLLENAGLAQANLRASKRRGKKRSRKEILQDVLDV